MLKQIKLVALDIDGTLLDDGLNISVKTGDKIRELINRGIHVALVTGRVYKSALNIANKLLVDVPIISYNGGNITVPIEGEIFNSKIPFSEAYKIMCYGEQNNIYTKVYIDNVLYTEKDDVESVEFVKNHCIEYNPIGKLSDNIHKNVNMIVFIYERKVCKGDINNLEHTDVSITMSTPRSLEFIPKGVSKGAGLKILAKYLNVNREEILAIGNSLNDLDMLQFAGAGIAMKNSDDMLLEQWDGVSKFSNNEEGVYHLIKQL